MGIQNGNFELLLVDNNNKMFKCVNDTFYLAHRSAYKIKIINSDSKRRANATIHVDGKKIGAFRIEKNSSITIERPVSTDKKLTFYAVDSIEGLKSKLDASSDTIGTINVKIDVESLDVDIIHETHRKLCSKGGTGLGDASSQRFTDADDIKTDDVVNLRAKMLLESDDREEIVVDNNKEFDYYQLEFLRKKVTDTEEKNFWLERKIIDKDMKISQLERNISDKAGKMESLEKQLVEERKIRDNFMKLLSSDVTPL